MKTETDYTGELLKFIKDMMGPNFTVLKHCDRFTTGIPDLTVSNSTRKTVWIEAKRIDASKGQVRKPNTWVDKDEELQLATLTRLGGFYVVYHPSHESWGFISAKTAFAHYHQKSAVKLLSDDEFVLDDTNRYEAYRKVVDYLKKELT